jgi:succinyl-CoA synthetase beta subunit
MLGNTLVTIQTGEAASRSTASTSPTARHRQGILPLAAGRPRHGRVAMIASTEGGMDIEEVAHDTPEKIITPSRSIPRPASCRIHGRALAAALELSGDLGQAGRGLAKRSTTLPSSPPTCEPCSRSTR